MQLPRFEYLRPDNLAEGLAILAERGADAKVLSGGSDLLINMKFRLDTPRFLVSFNGVPELQAIEELPDGGLRIGAGCKLTDLINDAAVASRFPALRDAMHSVGSRHIRNVGTLGGNLCLDTRCWYTNQSENWRATREGCYKTESESCHVIKTASRCHALNTSDTAPMLMALGASVELGSAAGIREVALADFYREDGVHHTVLEPGEILTAILVPRFGGRAVFAKLAQREGLDFASGTLAATVIGSNDAPVAVNLVMGSIAAAPKSLTASEQLLLESGLTDEAIDAAAAAARNALGKITNLFTPSGYKRRLVKNFVREALMALRDMPDGTK
jgi:4-hydroxybenzoyl-CoA reductase beta subunit